MKHIIILGDGMADEPLLGLGGRTPLQAARTPNMDRLARLGRNGILHTVPEGFKPGSEIANLSVLGYDVTRVFEGRGSLEAASMGVEIAPGCMAMRCNLITIAGGRIKNHSAGHISTAEAGELIACLNESLAAFPELAGGFGRVEFFPGVSYRHLLMICGGDKNIDCTPPHDVPGDSFEGRMVRSASPSADATARLVNDLILWSQAILADHPVNVKRRACGKDPANSIWPWSPGYRPQMETLRQRYGIGRGSVISAVDLIKGIGVYAGLEPVAVEGATGLWDTNYEGKCRAAIAALESEDFVFLHIEASDEAGHEGDVELKIKTIENLDALIVGPIFDWALEYNSRPGSEGVAVALLPDHPTPCHLRTHTADPVPVAVYNPAWKPDGVTAYDEESAAAGALGEMAEGTFTDKFMER